MPRILYKIFLLFLLTQGLVLIHCSAQDSYTITGHVKNEIGQALSGISVSIEGVLTDPVITGEDGSFSISSSSLHEWIIISPADKYLAQRIFLNKREYIQVTLTPEEFASVYDEVLNVFSPSLKRDLVSSLQDLNPGQFHLHPNQTIDQDLQGSIAGNFSTQRSGMPSSGAVTYIRGVKSMYTNSQPLYIIDGIPIESSGVFRSNVDGYSYNPLTTLDPNDITGISVIKDYIAGSVFGARGSNGIVLIETLEPSEVTTTIDVGVRTGINFVPETLPQISSMQYKSLANEILLSSGSDEENFPGDYPGLFNVEPDPGYFRYNHNTNWQNEVFSNSIFSDYYLRVRGGDQIARYGLSVGYLNQKGVVKNTGYDRFTIRFVGTFSVTKWLKMYISSNLSSTNSDMRESGRVRETSPILTALHKTPLMHPNEYDIDGNMIQTLSDVDELGVSNPASIINNFIAKNSNYRILTSMRLEGKISENLIWNTLIGINFNSMDENVFMPNHGMEMYYSGEAYNVSKSMTNSLLAIYNDNYITYSRLFSSRHKFSATGGIRINTNRNEEDWGLTKNSNENDEYRTLQSGTSYLREMGGLNGKWNRLAFYGSVNYTYSDKYLLYAGLTTQFSSRVGKNAKTISDPSASLSKGTSENILMIGDQPFGLFYALGGAWRLSSESFLKNVHWIEDVKLRLSWGSAGNDDIGNHNALRYYELSHYRETSGMVPGNITDKSLKFETNYQLNPGLDISLWANRLSVILDLYNIRTENMMVFQPQVSYTGFEIVSSNNGSLQNRGWEISMNSRIVSKGKFGLDVGFNLSRFNNEVLDISNGEIITPFLGGEFISRKGESLLNFYGYQFEGVYSSADEASSAGLRNERGISYGAGDARFSDLSGPEGEPDGIIDQYDKTIIGSPLPDFYGGAYTTITWGRWSISGQVQIVTGNEVFNYIRSQNEKMSDLSNQSTKVLKRWHYEGQETKVPRALWNDPIGNSDFSTRWIEDGSYVRLKYLTLAYKAKDKFLVFRNAEFYLTGMNLFTYSNYLGFDPEFSYSYNTMEQGIDYGLMPHTRKIMFGIKFGL